MIHKNKNRRITAPAGPAVKINQYIRAEELRVLGPEGENLGVMKTTEALKRAQEAGLDLVEVAATATPPVARIVNYDKYRYQQEKQARKQRQAIKAVELKHVRITPRAGVNDLGVKLRKVKDFLEEGNKVEIHMFLKGREKANKDFAKGKLVEFLNKVEPAYKITMPIKYAGRGFVVQIVKS